MHITKRELLLLQNTYFLWIEIHRKIITCCRLLKCVRTHCSVCMGATDKHLSGAPLHGGCVPLLHTESGQIAPPLLPATARTLRIASLPRERSNLFPLSGSGPARPDKSRLSNNNSRSVGTCHQWPSSVSLSVFVQFSVLPASSIC